MGDKRIFKNFRFYLEQNRELVATYICKDCGKEMDAPLHYHIPCTNGHIPMYHNATFQCDECYEAANKPPAPKLNEDEITFLWKFNKEDEIKSVRRSEVDKVCYVICNSGKQYMLPYQMLSSIPAGPSYTYSELIKEG